MVKIRLFSGFIIIYSASIQPRKDLVFQHFPGQLPSLNPGSIKQLLLAGAQRLPKIEGTEGANMFEQGAGRLDLIHSFLMLQCALLVILIVYLFYHHHATVK